MGNTVKRVVEGHSLRKCMNNESVSFTNVTHTDSHGWLLSLFQELLFIHSCSHRLYVSWRKVQRLKRGETWDRHGDVSNLCIVIVGIYCRVFLHSLQIQFFHLQTAYMEISHPLLALLMYEKAACFHPVHTPFKRFLLQSVRDEGCCTAFPVHLYGNELSYITFGRVFPSLLQTGSFFFTSLCQTRSFCPSFFISQSCRHFVTSSVLSFSSCNEFSLSSDEGQR